MAVSEMTPGRQLKGRHVLLILLGFFGSIFAVNGYFMYAALATYSGVVSSESYQKGLTYNDRIAADARQAALGWHHGLVTEGNRTLVLTLEGPDGRPVAGLRVAGTIGRPSTEGFDHALKFSENAPGRYVAETAPLDAGTWVASIEAFDGVATEPKYQGRNRLWLKP